MENSLKVHINLDSLLIWQNFPKILNKIKNLLGPLVIVFQFPILQCYCAFSAKMLQLYYASVLLCFSVTVLQFPILQCYCAFRAKMLQFSYAAVLLCWSATVLQCISANVLQYYCTAVLLYWLYCSTIVLTELQCFSATVLQCYFASVLLWYYA